MEEKILKYVGDSISLNGNDFSIAVDYSSISNSEVIKVIINGNTVIEVKNKKDLLKLRNLIDSVFNNILQDYTTCKSDGVSSYSNLGGIPSYRRTTG